MSSQCQVISHLDVMTHLFDHLLMFCPYHKIHRPLPSLNMNMPFKSCSVNDDVNMLIVRKTFLFPIEQLTIQSLQENSP